MNNVINAIKKYKIVAILRGIPSDKLLTTVEALYDGGIRLLEVTIDQGNSNGLENAAMAVTSIKKLYGEKLLVGAGTVLSVHDADAMINAGAHFILSPNSNIDVIAHTVRMNVTSIPGAYSPSEIVNDFESGADIVKVFPASILTADYFKALRGPLAHIPLLAVGGINTKNMLDFLRAGAIGVGVGSSLTNKKMIQESRFDELSKLAQSFTQQIGVK